MCLCAFRLFTYRLVCARLIFPQRWWIKEAVVRYSYYWRCGWLRCFFVFARLLVAGRLLGRLAAACIAVPRFLHRGMCQSSGLALRKGPLSRHAISRSSVLHKAVFAFVFGASGGQGAHRQEEDEIISFLGGIELEGCAGGPREPPQGHLQLAPQPHPSAR